MTDFVDKREVTQDMELEFQRTLERFGLKGVYEEGSTPYMCMKDAFFAGLGVYLSLCLSVVEIEDNDDGANILEDISKQVENYWHRRAGDGG